MTIRFKPQGIDYTTWPVDWLELSDDERRIQFRLMGNEQVRDYSVQAVIPDDEGRQLELEADEYHLTIEASWTLEHDDLFKRWQAFSDKPPYPDGGVRYGTV